MGKTIHDGTYRTLIADLTKERIRLNVSQGELARQIGLQQSDVSKIEQLERRLDALEFSRIVKALRINENPRLRDVVIRFMGLGE